MVPSVVRSRTCGVGPPGAVCRAASERRAVSSRAIPSVSAACPRLVFSRANAGLVTGRLWRRRILLSRRRRRYAHSPVVAVASRVAPAIQEGVFACRGWPLSSGPPWADGTAGWPAAGGLAGGSGALGGVEVVGAGGILGGSETVVGGPEVPGWGRGVRGWSGEVAGACRDGCLPGVAGRVRTRPGSIRLGSVKADPSGCRRPRLTARISG